METITWRGHHEGSVRVVLSLLALMLHLERAQ